MYCAWRATHSLNSSLCAGAADRIFFESFHHTLESRGVRVRPAFVCVEAESYARYCGISARTQHAERVHTIKHPAAKSHRLQHQCAGVATRGEFCRDLGQRPLLDKSQRPSLFNVHNVLKLFDARDRAIMHVVTNDGPILEKVAQSQEHVLR